MRYSTYWEIKQEGNFIFLCNEIWHLKIANSTAGNIKRDDEFGRGGLKVNNKMDERASNFLFQFAVKFFCQRTRVGGQAQLSGPGRRRRV